jgi:hypothetical protein
MINHNVTQLVEYANSFFERPDLRISGTLIKNMIKSLRQEHSLCNVLNDEEGRWAIECVFRQLEGLYHRKGVPEDVTQALMEAIGYPLERLQTHTYVPNASVFLPMLVDQHIHLNDFSLYKVMHQLAALKRPYALLEVAEKFMGLDQARAPGDMAENICQWLYVFSLKTEPHDNQIITQFFKEHAQTLLQGLRFQYLTQSPLALGMAQYFHQQGLKEMSQRYARAQMSWPQVMEHFKVMEEIGCAVSYETQKHLTQTSTQSKKVAMSTLYYHLTTPGFPWVGFDCLERDQAEVIQEVVEKLWGTSEALNDTIAAFVQRSASESTVVAEGLMRKKLMPEIAVACPALRASQLETDLGL